MLELVLGMREKTYICIDLKSFFASVECVERGLDPLNTNLVVADIKRTEKTICLAVSPALKSYGIPGRPRLFEVISFTNKLNENRKRCLNNHVFSGESCFKSEIDKIPNLKLSYIVARPQMALYIKYSSKIYNIYLKYIASEDIHVYSIDEVFIDATSYLKIYKMSGRDLAMMIIKDVLKETGITATVGISNNMYLAKVAMDIVAKKAKADKDGVRIACLDEKKYRELLWDHKPLTDFWRVGRGYSKRLNDCGLYTMGDVAKCSIENEDLLYKVFGINAELLIDHAWGYEPCTIGEIKNYRPESSSLSSGQVLKEPYSFEDAKIVIQEMADSMALSLVEKKLVTNQIIINVDYDVSNIKGSNSYNGAFVYDRYNRKVPKWAHGTFNLDRYTSSSKLIIDGTLDVFEKCVDKKLLIRKLNLCVNNVVSKNKVKKQIKKEQLNLFDDYTKLDEQNEKKENELVREEKAQEAFVKIKNKYGKNAVLKGVSYKDKSMSKERNMQIGGHRT